MMGGLSGNHDDRMMALSPANIASRAGGIGELLFA
jgi:hypothetical protein